MSLDKDHDTLKKMMMVLMDDVRRCHQALHSLEKSRIIEDQLFWRRVIARAVYSAMEGSCELLCQQAFLAEVKKVQENFVHPLKLCGLLGKTCVVTDEGEIRPQDLRAPFLGHVLFSLKSYAEAQGVSYRTKKGDQWHRVRNAVAVRHRITHPKNRAGLDISEQEIADVEFSLSWFLNELESIFREKVTISSA